MSNLIPRQSTQVSKNQYFFLSTELRKVNQIKVKCRGERTDHANGITYKNDTAIYHAYSVSIIYNLNVESMQETKDYILIVGSVDQAMVATDVEKDSYVEVNGFKYRDQFEMGLMDMYDSKQGMKNGKAVLVRVRKPETDKNVVEEK